MFFSDGALLQAKKYSHASWRDYNQHHQKMGGTTTPPIVVYGIW